MKYFGTDGIRGKVGEHPVIPEFFTQIAWAIGKVFAQQGEHAKVLIGKDTRISGYMLESAMQAGFAAAGADTMLVGPIPTPAIAYLTRTFQLDVGVVITASHNGYEDNGVKFFSADGTKLPASLEQQIEKYLDYDLKLVKPSNLGRAARLVDAYGRYIEFCKSSLPRNSNLKGRKLVVDCAHGATYNVAERVFRELGADLVTINNTPDGLNINRSCGSTYPECISRATKEHRADVGIAFDGDGDRVIMCDKQGRIVSGDVLLYILAKYMKEVGTLQSNKVIGTVATNYGLEKSLGKLDVELERVPVGDRHIIEELINKNRGNLGGESSGHMVCTRYTTTGDGIIIALQVLVALDYFKQDFAEFVEEAALVPSTQDNINCRNPAEIMQQAKLQATIRGLQQKFTASRPGRLLVRPSGTEPLLRVSVEAADSALRRDTISTIRKVVEQLSL